MLRRVTLTFWVVFLSGCGLPFIGIRAGYDAVAGRPADPTGKGGCDYLDTHLGHPNPDASTELILNPVSDPVPALYIASWCAETATCQSSSGQLRYFSDQPKPHQCIAYDELLQAQRQEQEREAQRQNQEALQKLLAESPVQSEQALKRDLDLAAKLTPEQQEAIRDVGNAVFLTADEHRTLASITPDQWHALSQLSAFFKWLNDKSQQAQTQDEKEHEQAEREEDRARLAAYQSLIADAAARQAYAAQWQAAILWRQQQCLNDLSHGLSCY
jgi:hypothetical protein